MRHPILLTLLCLVAAHASALGQEFELFNRRVQAHGFVSQGFAYSDQNNYLTMNTSQGSGAFTDAGFNFSAPITDRLRVGGQVYLRDIGQLGEGHPELDWAYGDYRFAEWFGIRVGKVKTVLGLYNDTQDADFLHTWAILPQSTYPLDLRSATIAHTGGDVYGHIFLRGAGALDYTGYFGLRSFDRYGGIYYFSADQGIPIDKDSGHVEGGDLRWTTPLTGLLVGSSGINLAESRIGHEAPPQTIGGTYKLSPDPDYIIAGYGDYRRGPWQLNGEFRREFSPLRVIVSTLPGVFIYNGETNKAWFLSVAYRFSKWLEMGTYHSRFLVEHPDNPNDPYANHVYDQTVTARFDFRRWWNFKVEGHFINGYGDVFSAHGFYARSNPNGLKPTTNMLVLRSGLNF
ncbi:MAG TPA: hypothetical protein VLW84_02280 [Terriglobales bacterium]|nr:hypothetical protein [Terriglobales bacterium]